MLFTINGRGHPKKIVIERAISIGDVSATLRNMTVPAKYRLASAEIIVETIVTIITEAATNEVTIEMHQVPADKIIDQDIRDHITCRQKTF
jgi:hypothetical protein